MHKTLKEVSFNLSVLYVEDDRIFSDQLVKFLNKFFKKVVTAANGQEAYQLYEKEEFDLVITDIDMPVMDGLELIHRVRRKNQMQIIMVISAHANNNYMLIELLNNGIFGFVGKPLDFDTLTRSLINVCSKIQDKIVLLHYLNELEKMQQNAISASCRSGCPIRETLSEPVQAPVSFDDDFFFFEPATTVQHANENHMIYKDYFQQLSAEDKEELYDVLGDIDSLLLSCGDAIDIGRLGSLLQRYGNVLLHYQFFSDMGSSMVEMGSIISSGSSLKQEETKNLIGGFCTVLQNFMREVWESEANDPKFFNDSIVNDARTIITLVTPLQAKESEDDLVFF